MPKPGIPPIHRLTQPLDHSAVGFDVIELLFAAIVAQDLEIRRLRGEKAAVDETAATTAAPDSAAEHSVASTDAYVGHIETPANPPVYTLKHAMSPQAQKPRLDETV